MICFQQPFHQLKSGIHVNVIDVLFVCCRLRLICQSPFHQHVAVRAASEKFLPSNLLSLIKRTRCPPETLQPSQCYPLPVTLRMSLRLLKQPLILVNLQRKNLACPDNQQTKPVLHITQTFTGHRMSFYTTIKGSLLLFQVGVV